MAQVFSANVYKINGSDVTVERFGFPAGSVLLRQAPANTRTQAGVNLYGIIQLKRGGLEVLNQDQYYTVETVSALAALANA